MKPPTPAGWLYLIKDASGVQVSSSCSWPEPRSFHLDPEGKASAIGWLCAPLGL
jgi:hypothetical protein